MSGDQLSAELLLRTTRKLRLPLAIRQPQTRSRPRALLLGSVTAAPSLFPSNPARIAYLGQMAQCSAPFPLLRRRRRPL